jgi:hypothetical protein
LQYNRKKAYFYPEFSITVPFYSYLIINKEKSITKLPHSIYLSLTESSSLLRGQYYFVSRGETELRAFFVDIATLSFFILSLFFLEGKKKRERESNGDKKCTELRFIVAGSSLIYDLIVVFHFLTRFMVAWVQGWVRN